MKSGASATETGAPLDLSSVTLCAATSVNLKATVKAMKRCLAQVRFAEAVLFTNVNELGLPPEISLTLIAPLTSSLAYSQFILHELPRHVRTPHCLVVQWDGFLINACAWDPVFLDFDYIGAPWPQFSDGLDVGNGGFSLRSQSLLKACQSPTFVSVGAEDVAICRTNRTLLQHEFGIRFADRPTAAHFAYERERAAVASFGFHGVFNLIEVVGVQEFWEIYLGLDDRSTIGVDFWPILAKVLQGPQGYARACRMVLDRLLRG